MPKKPFFNALYAALYIVLVATIMNTISNYLTTHVQQPENTILMPIVMLSLFVLSAAIMGFLFVADPFRLYFENKKQEAVSYFLKTVGFFACFGAAFLIILLAVLFR